MDELMRLHNTALVDVQEEGASGVSSKEASKPSADI
jgi:hypothetical protein